MVDGRQRAQGVTSGKMDVDGNGSRRSSSEAQLRSTTADTESSRLSRKRSRSGSRIHQGSPPTLQKLSPIELLLDQCIERDELHNTALKAQTEHRDAILKSIHEDIQMWKDHRVSAPPDPSRGYGDGFAGYSNGWTAQYPTKVVYPALRKRSVTRRMRELRVPRRERSIQSDQIEELVPIRLDLELEKLRIRDTFTWNVYDRIIPAHLFAEGLIADLKIPPEAGPGFAQQILQSFQEQILDHHPHPFMEDEPLDPHLPYSAYKNDEIRIVIKLNITIGEHTLVDQFDWDINNQLNSPEDFAVRMANDLSLSGEFMTAIAHSIREQSQMYTRSLYISGHPFDGRPVEDAEIRENLLPSPLPSSFRPFATVKEYTPYFYELAKADMERADMIVSREQRLQKRQVTRRGGPAMPDLKERLGTVRTMIVSTVVPGAAESVETSGIYKPVRPPSGRGRRPFKNDRGEDSDVSESDQSPEEESPVRNPATQGPTRTRGIRGAASAAQAAMRATLAGSMTPETQAHHHETRTRRHGGYEIREDSTTETASFMLRLKMPRAKYRVWWRNYKETMKRREATRFLQEQEQQRQQALGPSRHDSQQPVDMYGAQLYNTGGSRGSSPQYNGSMGPPPPTTPGVQHRYIPGQQQQFSNGYQPPGSTTSNDVSSQNRYTSKDVPQRSPAPRRSNGGAATTATAAEPGVCIPRVFLRGRFPTNLNTASTTDTSLARHCPQ